MRARNIVISTLLVALFGCADDETALRDGAQLAGDKGCVACHGLNGLGTTPAFPNLAGQWPRYLAAQLKAYRDGTRTNAVMNMQAANLSDADITLLADYYSKQ